MLNVRTKRGFRHRMFNHVRVNSMIRYTRGRRTIPTEINLTMKGNNRVCAIKGNIRKNLSNSKNGRLTVFLNNSRRVERLLRVTPFMTLRRQRARTVTPKLFNNTHLRLVFRNTMREAISVSRRLKRPLTVTKLRGSLISTILTNSNVTITPNCPVISPVLRNKTNRMNNTKKHTHNSRLNGTTSLTRPSKLRINKNKLKGTRRFICVTKRNHRVII